MYPFCLRGRRAPWAPRPPIIERWFRHCVGSKIQCLFAAVKVVPLATRATPIVIRSLRVGEVVSVLRLHVVEAGSLVEVRRLGVQGRGVLAIQLVELAKGHRKPVSTDARMLNNPPRTRMERHVSLHPIFKPVDRSANPSCHEPASMAHQDRAGCPATSSRSPALGNLSTLVLRLHVRAHPQQAPSAQRHGRESKLSTLRVSHVWQRCRLVPRPRRGALLRRCGAEGALAARIKTLHRTPFCARHGSGSGRRSQLRVTMPVQGSLSASLYTGTLLGRRQRTETMAASLGGSSSPRNFLGLTSATASGSWGGRRRQPGEQPPAWRTMVARRRQLRSKSPSCPQCRRRSNRQSTLRSRSL